MVEVKTYKKGLIAAKSLVRCRSKHALCRMNLSRYIYPSHQHCTDHDGTVSFTIQKKPKVRLKKVFSLNIALQGFSVLIQEYTFPSVAPSSAIRWVVAAASRDVCCSIFKLNSARRRAPPFCRRPLDEMADGKPLTTECEEVHIWKMVILKLVLIRMYFFKEIVSCK